MKSRRPSRRQLGHVTVYSQKMVLQLVVSASHQITFSLQSRNSYITSCIYARKLETFLKVSDVRIARCELIKIILKPVLIFKGYCLTQLVFVRACVRSKLPTTFYKQKLVHNDRFGNYFIEFCSLHASHA